MEETKAANAPIAPKGWYRKPCMDAANHARRASPQSTSCQKAAQLRRERLDRVRGEPRAVRRTPGGSKQITGQA
ncbi:hypothetical protein V6N12_058167 [Hibiscus sabdariffa]|uniref:Uncharacterized protein n=1 Tax=Hibiscus sabdariffa TaxID=183260 RepID=A0ABR2ACT6_9ROSI